MYIRYIYIIYIYNLSGLTNYFCFSFLYLGMDHYGLLVNIFGGGSYCLEAR